MNGTHIENLLERIDLNIGLSSDEAARYIRDNENEIALSLSTIGTAVIKTKAGDLVLSLADLELTAA